MKARNGTQRQQRRLTLIIQWTSGSGRVAREWTQERAAEAAGLNTRHYQKIERGSVNVTIGRCCNDDRRR